MRVTYETGIETPEILGSGSSYSNVATTSDESEAFELYRKVGRNYLLRRIRNDGAPRKTEWWCDWDKCWRT